MLALRDHLVSHHAEGDRHRALLSQRMLVVGKLQVNRRCLAPRLIERDGARTRALATLRRAESDFGLLAIAGVEEDPRLRAALGDLQIQVAAVRMAAGAW